jgi:hypothetical protein
MGLRRKAVSKHSLENFVKKRKVSKNLLFQKTEYDFFFSDLEQEGAAVSNIAPLKDRLKDRTVSLIFCPTLIILRRERFFSPQLKARKHICRQCRVLFLHRSEALERAQEVAAAILPRKVERRCGCA